MHNDTQQRVHLRPMTEGDIRQALSIARESFPFDDPLTEDDFFESIIMPQLFGLVADDGEDVVGFMLYGKDKRGVYLSDIAVAPHVRKAGIGRQMIVWLQQELPRLSKTTLALDVHAHNTEAKRLYERLGFVQHAQTEDVYPDGCAAIEMVFSATGKNTRPASLHVSI